LSIVSLLLTIHEATGSPNVQFALSKIFCQKSSMAKYLIGISIFPKYSSSLTLELLVFTALPHTLSFMVEHSLISVLSKRPKTFSLISYLLKVLKTFPSGSYVMARDMEATSSLDAPYDGPYQVVRRTSHGTYILRDAMSRVLARNYAPEQLKIAARPDLPQDASETSYEVERIISHRTAPGGKTLYLVKWKGYDDSQNSEILAEHFDSKNLMTRYHRSLKQIKPSSQKPPSK
ncbi:hypothetical protein BGZ70_005583, partial [Mortierella alpina]